MKSNNKRWIAVLLILLIGGALLLGRKQLLQKIGNHLVIEDELIPADIIHVIAGDDYRTEYAVELYRQGYAKYLFFTGGWCKFHGYEHGEHARQLALAGGVPPQAILTDDSPVLSTFDETLRLKAWMDQHPGTINSIIVVSDPFHMRRARWTNQFIFGKGIQTRMAPVPFELTPFQMDWWQDKESFNYVKEEYIKLVYYFFRYRLGFGWLASFDTE